MKTFSCTQEHWPLIASNARCGSNHLTVFLEIDINEKQKKIVNNVCEANGLKLTLLNIFAKVLS